MQRYYTKTFFTFLFAFLLILGVGFTVAVVASPASDPASTSNVDNVAVPR